MTRAYLLALAIGGSFGCAAPSVLASDVDQAYRLEFFGLNCEVCEDQLKERFEALPTVREAHVDMLSLKACLKSKGSAAPSRQELGRVLTQAGFNFIKLEKTAKC